MDLQGSGGGTSDGVWSDSEVFDDERPRTPGVGHSDDDEGSDLLLEGEDDMEEELAAAMKHDALS